MNFRNIDPDRRWIEARRFLDQHVVLHRHDVLGTHRLEGRVLTVARMVSSQTSAVIVLNTQNGDVALSLATVASIEPTP
jgi:hemolysin activation/secretion protein